MNFAQGTRGFVRVQAPTEPHFTGDEVWTIIGQNTFALENWPGMDVYAYAIPGPPGGLSAGVAAPRPPTSVTVTLRNAQGQIKGSQTVPPAAPYAASFAPAMILGGDVVEVTISYASMPALDYDVVVAPITANADLKGNQVTGTGPPNTCLVVAAGSVQGYVTASAGANYTDWVTAVASNGGGSFASGPVGCSAGNGGKIGPGTFGYAGYEAAGGNFVSVAYAVPANYVMSDFAFVDGWVGSGVVTPTIAVAGPNGAIKQPPSPAPTMGLWLINDQMPINTYYETGTSVYVEPGDVVTVVSGKQTSTIPVDSLSARLYANQSIVAGNAPAGATLRVIPDNDRAYWKTLVVPAGGGYAATNPYTTIDRSCAASTKAESLSFDDVGRVYLEHADGNAVFTTYATRALGALESGNTGWVTAFTTRGIGWLPASPRPVTLTFTPAAGQLGAGTGHGTIPSGLAGEAENIPLYQANSAEALIRSDGTVTATFNEGPDWLQRPVTLTLGPLALLTASPDTAANTLAGVGPVGWQGPDAGALAAAGVAVDWSGAASIQAPLSASTTLPQRNSTAWGPLTFGSPVVALQSGYRGQLEFVDPLGNVLYMYWGVTNVTYQVKISGPLGPGDTQVCGTVTAPAGLSLPGEVDIHDLTNNPTDIMIGTGSIGAQGLFCVPVNPPLYLRQVVVAYAGSSWSQPVVVSALLFLPLLNRQQ